MSNTPEKNRELAQQWLDSIDKMINSGKSTTEILNILRESNNCYNKKSKLPVNIGEALDQGVHVGFYFNIYRKGNRYYKSL